LEKTDAILKKTDAIKIFYTPRWYKCEINNI
jgi:hypothetical protein